MSKHAHVGIVGKINVHRLCVRINESFDESNQIVRGGHAVVVDGFSSPRIAFVKLNRHEIHVVTVTLQNVGVHVGAKVGKVAVPIMAFLLSVRQVDITTESLAANVQIGLRRRYADESTVCQTTEGEHGEQA